MHPQLGLAAMRAWWLVPLAKWAGGGDLENLLKPKNLFFRGLSEMRTPPPPPVVYTKCVVFITLFFTHQGPQ